MENTTPSNEKESSDFCKAAIDLPDINSPDGPWVTFDNFTSRAEAIEYAKKHFGADDEGRICIVTNLPD